MPANSDGSRMKTFSLVVLTLTAACAGHGAAVPDAGPRDARSIDAQPAAWRLPAGWRPEVIPFPLGFAPSLAHTGLEELRFPPGMFDMQSPSYFSYAFVWRLDDAAVLDANAVASELTAYFRGLMIAVDTKHLITSPQDIVVAAAVASPPATGFTFTGHLFDAFNQASPLDVSGNARRVACGGGSLWVFYLSPAGGSTAVRSELAQLAAEAQCGQPVPRS
jgi:hypothetical protein